MTFPPGRAPSSQMPKLGPRRQWGRSPAPVGVAGIFSRAAPGETSYTTSGTFQFIVPKDVRFISAVCIGKGGDALYPPAAGGAGGGLAWRNRIPVVPGETLFVVNDSVATVIRRGSATRGAILVGASAAVVGVPGVPLVGQGGSGGVPSGSGGGGAGGYAGSGGAAGQGMSGGAAGGGFNQNDGGNPDGGGGGGTGLTGLTTTWDSSTGGVGATGGGAGVGGSAGGDGTYVFCPTCPCTWRGGNGGNYGGGGGVGICSQGSGAIGAVRIIWPGETRSFPYDAV